MVGAILLPGCFLSALTVLVAAAALTPIAAAGPNLQVQRLAALDAHTKTTVEHEIQVEYLNH
ncbi:MAG: hypothetical protein AAFO59_04345 [Cyanobacteria bacterium J06607_17]